MSKFTDHANELVAGLPEGHPAFRFIEEVRAEEQLLGDLTDPLLTAHLTTLEQIIADPHELDPSAEAADEDGWEADFRKAWAEALRLPLNGPGDAVHLFEEHLVGSIQNFNDLVGPLPAAVVYRAIAHLLVRVMDETFGAAVDLRD